MCLPSSEISCFLTLQWGEKLWNSFPDDHQSWPICWFRKLSGKLSFFYPLKSVSSSKHWQTSDSRVGRSGLVLHTKGSDTRKQHRAWLVSCLKQAWNCKSDSGRWKINRRRRSENGCPLNHTKFTSKVPRVLAWVKRSKGKPAGYNHSFI